MTNLARMLDYPRCLELHERLAVEVDVVALQSVGAADLEAVHLGAVDDGVRAHPGAEHAAELLGLDDRWSGV